MAAAVVVMMGVIVPGIIPAGIAVISIVAVVTVITAIPGRPRVPRIVVPRVVIPRIIPAKTVSRIIKAVIRVVEWAVIRIFVNIIYVAVCIGGAAAEAVTGDEKGILPEEPFPLYLFTGNPCEIFLGERSRLRDDVLSLIVNTILERLDLGILLSQAAGDCGSRHEYDSKDPG